MLAESNDSPPTQALQTELIEALGCVANHDAQAMNRVYALTSAKLFGICFRVCGNRAGAEDVMQEVLLKIWYRAGSFDPGRSSPITWLCAIARHSAIDWLRVQSRKKTLPFDLPEHIASSGVGAEQHLLDREAQHRLHLCIDQLEERQRYCIRAAFFDGLTYADLADDVDVPLNTVKTWIRRGMQQLRKCVSDD